MAAEGGGGGAAAAEEAAARRRRRRPNLLVTGTPGTGKTTTSSLLADATALRHVNVGDLVRDKGLHDGWDDEFDCYIINEDLVRSPPNPKPKIPLTLTLTLTLTISFFFNFFVAMLV